MDLFNILAILITLTALFSYINHRYIGLPITIGVMFIALLMSLLLNLLDALGFGLKHYAQMVLGSIQFDKTLLHGMLSFLLFAGALHINLGDLMERRWSIGILATLGTLMSTFLVGTFTWFGLRWFGFELSYIYCLLFGALISPTDPIAVLSILKTTSAPKSLEMKIAGESLFNDGVGVVVFIVILEIATGAHELNAGHIGLLLVQEIVGGACLGLGLGYLAYRMLKSVDNYQVEILISLALVVGGYALAGVLHFSGPIAIVVAGLLIGNHGRLFAMSDETRLQLDTFWELVDGVLNAVLFVLIGLEILILTFTKQYLLLSLLIIPFVLTARFISIGIPLTLLRSFRTFSPGAVRILTWGGLRGGISVALALSIPPAPEKHLILIFTYTVVLFSILVQGSTIEKLVKHLMR
ncbi:MAG: sodium:proton antiporter [Deltaproteobacteria bacterium]|nr:sodium:proton antiporter [Deltaproteobacteria bacterium]